MGRRLSGKESRGRAHAPSEIASDMTSIITFDLAAALLDERAAYHQHGRSSSANYRSLAISFDRP